MSLSETRGAEATGIFYTKDDTYSIEKQPVAASTFITEILPKHIDNIKKANIAFGHTRFPTQGSPTDNNNNHPVDSENWILIHNGSVTKMPRLSNFNYKGEVDSEILISYIEKYGLKEGLPYVERGSAAVALINKHDLNSIYLWREANPLVVACDSQSNTLFFASQKEFLEKGLANRFLLFTSFQIREVPSNLLIKITIDPFAVVSMGYVEVMKHNPIRYTHTPLENGLVLCKDMIFNPSTNRWELSTVNPTITTADPCSFLTSDKKCSKGYTTPCPTDKYTCDYFTHESDINIIPSNPLSKKYLKDHGFTDDEIGRMTKATIATIVYCGYNGAKISITKGGDIVLRESYIEDKPLEVSNRYYIDAMSKDFKNWSKLTKPNKGHLSMDGILIKKWDNIRKSHYIMLVGDAIKEKLINEVILQEDLDYESDELLSDMSDRIDMED